jgi:glyoxylase-like metal-dependent hydrolase (beta-lactamase superfamily II)
VRIADGPWRLTRGFLLTNHAYLVAEADGVAVFDAGVREMTPAIFTAAAGSKLTRVVLGHSHWDYRGAAPALARCAALICHPLEAADAQGDGGLHCFQLGLQRSHQAAWLLDELRRRRDGGPVALADTIAEGDQVGGFDVVFLPGHSPGQIGLFRRGDRLAVVSDAIYTIDADSGRKTEPRLPHTAYNFDDRQARESIRALAQLEPHEVWAGHADPILIQVRRRLLRGGEVAV